MSDPSEIDEGGVRSAFDGYRADPGGEIRLDLGAIAAGGRRRVRRQRITMGAVGVVAVAVLVSGASIAPQVAGRGADLAAQPGSAIPDTGRDLESVFKGAGARDPERPLRSGGAATELGLEFAAELDREPNFLDAAWQAGLDDSKPDVRWALFTWTEGQKAAEGLLTVQSSPIWIAIFPAPYTVCDDREREGGRTCTVKEVAGVGWLKVIRSAPGAPPELLVTLQRTGRELVTFSLHGGMAGSAALAGGRTDLGRLPLTEEDVSAAVLTTP